MSLRLNTSMSSLTVQRHLFHASTEKNDHLRRLSSGLRIERASDDAAGLGIAERMNSRVRSMVVAERNTQDGISLLETFEGYLGELSQILMREKELVLQAYNETLNADDLAIIEQEHQENSSEITRIISEAEFNGNSLMNGVGQINIQVGLDAGDTVGIDTVNFSPLGPGLSVAHMNVEVGRSWILNLADEYIGIFSDLRGTVGAKSNRLSSAMRGLMQGRSDLTAAHSRIRDADMAVETAGLTRSSILEQAGVAVLTQALQQPSIALQLL